MSHTDEPVRDLLLPTPPRTWRRWTGGQMKTWVSAMKADLKPLIGPPVFSYERWRKDWVKVPRKLEHYSVHSIGNSCSSAATSKTHIAASLFGLIMWNYINKLWPIISPLLGRHIGFPRIVKEQQKINRFFFFTVFRSHDGQPVHTRHHAHHHAYLQGRQYMAVSVCPDGTGSQIQTKVPLCLLIEQSTPRNYCPAAAIWRHCALGNAREKNAPRSRTVFLNKRRRVIQISACDVCGDKRSRRIWTKLRWQEKRRDN